MSLPSATAVLTAFLTISSLSFSAEEKPRRLARFLAIGDSPPFRQEIRDDVRYELDPPEGSVPPREIIPGFDKEVSEALTLRLGFITAPVKVPAGEGILNLRRVGDAADASPWLNINRPESGDFLVFLFRSPKQKTWNEATSLVVPESPAGTVRIVNLLPVAVNVQWGREAVSIAAGKNLLKNVAPGSETPFQILVADSSGAFKRYYSGAVTQNANERGLVTIYRADGESPRRPVKVSMLREPVVPPPPPKEEKKKDESP
jgi:hypothetical protein